MERERRRTRRVEGSIAGLKGNERGACEFVLQCEGEGRFGGGWMGEGRRERAGVKKAKGEGRRKGARGREGGRGRKGMKVEREKKGRNKRNLSTSVNKGAVPLVSWLNSCSRSGKTSFLSRSLIGQTLQSREKSEKRA